MSEDWREHASAGERFDAYLRSTRARLKAFILARAGLAGVLALVVLVAGGVWWLQRDGFPAAGVLGWRLALVVVLAAIALALVWLPLRALARGRGAPELERRLPLQQGRIDTYLELREKDAQRAGAPSPFIDLIAEDALRVADAPDGGLRITRRHVGIAAAAAAVLALAFAAVLFFGSSYWGYGTRHLMFGATLPVEAVPVRSIAVTPGDATLRRNADLRIRAQVKGFDPAGAEVFVRYEDSGRWERAPMKAATANDGRAEGFDFTLFALRAPLEYYVAAGSVRSAQHKVQVVDLPRVESFRLTYVHPQWTGLPEHTDEETRDVRAVEGTRVKLEIITDAPLDAPALVVDGATGTMQPQPNVVAPAGEGAARTQGRTTGELTVAKPGTYHIAARVAGEIVPLTDEYTIEIAPDEKPVVEILKPGRDARASAIEEVPVRIRASDDFRLQNVELRYSVNGGKWQSASVPAAGKREADGSTVLQLEELGGAGKPLVAGDLVSYYAVARDRAQNVQTDLYMVQVQAFDRRFTQGQAGGGGGGGGGGGDEQNAISERQKEILLATWNLQRAKAQGDERAEDNSIRRNQDSARMLGELQETLSQQTRTLIERTKARASDDDPQVKEFLTHLDNAADAMDPAARHLTATNLTEAIPVEQQALQHLQRAEATFRDIQVMRQQQGGGGGGGGQSQAADISELFELEMDLNKNQYETQAGLQNSEREQEQMTDAIRRLKELAARQEKLAQEARERQAQVTPEQKWRQEQLRREVEELKRRLEQLARQESQQGGQQGQQGRSGQQQGSEQNGQRGSQGSAQGGSQGQSQGGQSGQSGQSGDPSTTAAVNELNNALERMRRGDPGSEQAARDLKRALEQLDKPRSERMAGELGEAAERAQELASNQRDIQNELQDALRGQERLDRRRTEQIAQSKEQLLAELKSLQQELRQAAQENRATSPETSKRVNEIASELDGSGATSRLSRSIDEMRFGRARELAPREGIVTEALDTLAKDLREAAAGAGRERPSEQPGESAQQLLAQLGDLRRALEEAQRQGRAGNGNERSQQQGRQGEGQGEGQREGQGQPPEGQQGQNQGQGESQSQGEGQGEGQGDGNSNSSSESRTAGNQGGNAFGAGGGSDLGTDDWGGNAGLGAWNAIGSPDNWQSTARQPRSDAPQAAALMRRLQELEGRMRSGTLTRAQIDALRELNRGVRALGTDSVAGQAEMMRRLIDQMEMAALASVERSRRDAPARTAVPAPDSPAYREAAAEYYRRLGGT